MHSNAQYEEIEMKAVEFASVILGIILIIILFFKVILPYIESKQAQRHAEAEELKEKLARCASCRHCKMTYDDGYIVCDEMEADKPTFIPCKCYRCDYKGIPPIPFDELDEIDVDFFQ